MTVLSSWCLWLSVICSLIWSIFGIKGGIEYAMTCALKDAGNTYPKYVEAFISFDNGDEKFTIKIKDATSYNEIAIGFSKGGFFTDDPFTDASDSEDDSGMLISRASNVITNAAYAIVITATDSGFSGKEIALGGEGLDHGEAIDLTTDKFAPENNIDVKASEEDANDWIIKRSYQDGLSGDYHDTHGISFADDGDKYGSSYVDWFCHLSRSSSIDWTDFDYSYGELIIDDDAIDATVSTTTKLTPWFFAIDVSGSMSNEIDAVRDLINNLVGTDERKKYFLTLYHNQGGDGSVEPISLFETQTRTFFSIKAFRHEISYNVQVQDGTVCAESTLAGIDECANAAGNILGDEDYANMFVFTDANTQTDGQDSNMLGKQIGTMVGHVKVHFILTGYFCHPLPTTMDSNYQTVADLTGGIIMWTPTSGIDVNQVVFNIESILVSENIQTIAAVSFGTSYFAKTFTVSGDSGAAALYIHISCGFQESVTICSFEKDNSAIDAALYEVSDANSGYKTIQISGADISGVYSLSFALDGDSCSNRRRGRNLLETSNSTRKLTIYLINAAILLDYSVQNVNNNDIDEIADTTIGFVNYDEDGSFSVIVSPSNDESNDNIQSIDTITIISGDGLASISQNAILLSTLGDNNQYYALFEFMDLDNVGLNEFKIEVIGTDINGIEFVRQSSTTTQVSYLTAILECDGEGANSNLIFVGSQMICSLTITRQDTSTDTSIDLTVTSNNAFLNGNDLLTYTFDNSILLFSIGVATMTTSLTVSIDEANSNAVDETFRLTVNGYESSNDAYIYATDGIFKIVNDWCPVTCDNINVIDGLDICDCSEITNCVAGACHSNGCNECENGYFKKGYDYNCENCNDLFGDNCLFCQDFQGCGQCKLGSIKTLDADCGMYYCLSNSDSGNFVDGSTICEQIGTECDETTIADCGGQCDGGTWKLDVNTECVSCNDIFGDACLFCQDFHGCGQCDVGYNRVQTDECGDFTIWKCE